MIYRKRRSGIITRFTFPAWDVGKASLLEERLRRLSGWDDASWKGNNNGKKCRNSTIAANLAVIHHVSLPVSDLARSVAFYRGVLGLRHIDRPGSTSKGAWFCDTALTSRST